MSFARLVKQTSADFFSDQYLSVGLQFIQTQQALETS